MIMTKSSRPVNYVSSIALQSILNVQSANPRGLRLFPTPAVTSGRDTGCGVQSLLLGDQPAVGRHLGQSLPLELVAAGCGTQGPAAFVTSSKERGSLHWKTEEKPVSISEPHPGPGLSKVNNQPTQRVKPNQRGRVHEEPYLLTRAGKRDHFSCKRTAAVEDPV